MAFYRILGGPQGRSGQLLKISPQPGFDSQTAQPARCMFSSLTLSLLMSYICGAPCKVINFNIVYTGCNRRNGPNFGRVFLMLNCTEKTQKTYIQS
jgi:hypothetical protein